MATKPTLRYRSGETPVSNENVHKSLPLYMQSLRAAKLIPPTSWTLQQTFLNIGIQEINQQRLGLISKDSN